MNKNMTLTEIIINKEDNIVGAIVSLIDHKIFNEDLEMEDAYRETLEYLQQIMPVYQVSADKEHSDDLMELIRIRYEDYKITRRLSRIK
jgi:hypothetical protein